ncbi:hypothetical protein ACFLS9_06480, partial [Bacteroidota bacterium]
MEVLNSNNRTIITNLIYSLFICLFLISSIYPQNARESNNNHNIQELSKNKEEEAVKTLLNSKQVLDSRVLNALNDQVELQRIELEIKKQLTPE